jgi:EAL domain-containing protein (putative c-di-GMP-specific phosphodiesterase class I)/GGDEF domain-containing protein
MHLSDLQLAVSHDTPRLAGVILIDPEERVLFADPQVRALLGMPGGSEGTELGELVRAEAIAAIRIARDAGPGGSHALPLHDGALGGVAVSAVHHANGGRGLGFVVQVTRELPALRTASTAATRQALINRVERALGRARRRSDYNFGLLWIEFPHTAGQGRAEADDLHVAEVLQDAVRPMDMAAQLGPGQFGVLLHGLGDEVDAFHVARRLHGSLRRHHGAADDAGMPRLAAIGVVLSADATTADAMLRQAEAAAALARWERGRVAAFEPRRHLRAAQQLRVEEELPEAISDGQLRLMYQPIVSVDERHVVGFEALVRWQHPQDGLLLPDRFVVAAERAGLIAQMDLWVLATACGQARRWLEEGVLGEDGFVSVNLSGRTLDRDDTADRVLEALVSAGLEPARLQLEITETALVERTDVANATLVRLRAAGAQVAIDDFGSGYCSLAYLQRLPVDALKLDRSLLRARDSTGCNSRLLEGVMALAKCMDLPVTIEGVETGVDIAFLDELRGGHAQGFAFSPPLDPQAAAAFAGPPEAMG